MPVDMPRIEARSPRELNAHPRVLVVDDEADIRELLDMTLARMGFSCDCARSVAEATRMMRERVYGLCLTDMRMPDADGLDLVRHIAAEYPFLPVAVITAHGSTENAVTALKAGAFDYLSKPVSLAQLRSLVKSALSLPIQSSGATDHSAGLLGSSASIERVRQLIARVARSEAPVYLSGESGTGKELAARLIHSQSVRRDKPFIPVNCGAIPENLMESEFFGYRKGAFTGADTEREGFFQAADSGTLFLDEVADLPLPMQVKLLRAIQEKRVRRVGATSEEPINVRILCATHQNLGQLVREGRFRQDLFFRVNVIEIRMPSLRECREDIPELTSAILARLADKEAPMVTPEALAALQRYDYPGNVRELENILERALALHSGNRILPDDLQLAGNGKKVDGGGTGLFAGASLPETLDKMERDTIREALTKTHGNRTAAARLLGISFRSLRYRIERLGLHDIPER